MEKNDMTGEEHMKNSRFFFLVFYLCFHSAFTVVAQDMMPLVPSVNVLSNSPVTLRPYTFEPDTICFMVELPKALPKTEENILLDEKKALDPIFEKFRLARLNAVRDSIRIVHIGDSHVRGRIFPNTVGEKLAETFGPIKYEDMGVNGATCLTFTHPARIEAIIEAHPDVLILSFGTNESHNRRYSSAVHYNQIDELVKMIRTSLPEVSIILTTPPGSYESFKQRNRKRTYSINPRTSIAVDIIKRYAAEHNLAVWDMYNLVGGKKSACTNWKAAGLLRPDHVHYLPEGYVLHGELLSEAIINSYNRYVSH